ncbi:ABC transporter permease [Lactobacillus sp. ESL0791]|uniref:ABC transporter permease n=1 Tax=Lactobacillus sp. ESL0791 TaxID=2983234 RepID=UPI0023F97DE2|nr:ABC transporter permease [Lactobacillus sp. ESL0791]MDF7638517.1 ABC transporter permease [Lactobacillus sp. ESL0791]
MAELAKKRLVENFKQSLKYLLLVFNDFFILALIFLFGALMFWYAQAMKEIPANLWFYKLLVGLFLAVPLLIGKLVTLLKKADAQFLFTQDRQMKAYLRPLLLYSMIVPSLILLLLAGILFPFAAIKAGIKPLYYLLAVLLVLVCKFIQLEISKHNLFFSQRLPFWLFNIVSVLFLLAGLYYPLALILGLILVMLAGVLVVKQTGGLFNWRFAIKAEEARKNQVYSLFSMFTDVKERRVTIKRRKYLDWLLPRSLAKENPNKFLYRRSLLRNPEYLNLLVRMTVFAVLISWLVQNWAWALGLSCLVIFLTVYQLLPLTGEFDQNIMYRVYPIERANRGRAMAQVVSEAILLEWGIIAISWKIVLPVGVFRFSAILLLLVFAALVTLGYLPYKIKEGEK